MPSKFSGGNFPKSHLDSRDDLGYGRTSPKYHVHRDLGGSTFPYWDESEGMDVDDVELDDDLDTDAMHSKVSGPQGQDPLAKMGTNPFYYTAGNTKLGEAVVTNSISPVPGMYKNKRRTASGGKLKGRTARADASTDAPTIDPGDSRGWATMYDSPESEEPIENLEDLADKRLRECIRLILLGFGE